MQEGKRSRLARAARAGALALLLAAPALADRLITHDGRILEVEKARELPDGNYQLVFESGEIVCPRRFVASVEIEGDMSDYVPANEEEKKKLAQGYVRYRGRWWSKSGYEVELARAAELSKARTAEIAAHARFADGWVQETKHFRIQTNTSPELLAYYAELLETYYDLMDQRLGIDPSPSLKKTKIRVSIYKSYADFEEIAKPEDDVAGFFDFVAGELHFYHDYGDPTSSDQLALHEGTHLLTFLIEPQALPCIWINEGVADYFGSARIERNKKGKLEIRAGELEPESVLTVQEALADGSHVPLEELFLTPREEFEAFEYAHAWSFVYFLNNARPEYERAFKKFFKDLYTIAKGVAFEVDESGGNKYGSWKVVPPVEVRRLLLEKLGLKDVARLEEEWKAYVTALPIDGARARFLRGVKILQRPTLPAPEELARALADLDAALEGGLEDPRAYWARGTLKLYSEGNPAKTIEDYRRAVELAPLEGVYRASLAGMLSGMFLILPGLEDGEEAPPLTAPDEALGEAETLYCLACELEPENQELREVRDTYLDLLQKKSGTK